MMIEAGTHVHPQPVHIGAAGHLLQLLLNNTIFCPFAHAISLDFNDAIKNFLASLKCQRLVPSLISNMPAISL